MHCGLCVTGEESNMKLEEERDQHHHAYLNLSNFVDQTIGRPQELNTNLNKICRNRFLDFAGADYDVNVIWW